MYENQDITTFLQTGNEQNEKELQKKHRIWNDNSKIVGESECLVGAKPCIYERSTLVLDPATVQATIFLSL